MNSSVSGVRKLALPYSAWTRRKRKSLACSDVCSSDLLCANAIKIQIWVTLIANLLLTLLQRGVTHAWSFSGLAIVRIMLMYYIDVMGFLEHPEKDWEVAIEEAISSPPATE